MKSILNTNAKFTFNLYEFVSIVQQNLQHQTFGQKATFKYCDKQFVYIKMDHH